MKSPVIGPEPKNSFSPRRILVVDDEPLICELIQEVLDAAEIKTHAIWDSTEASSLIQLEKFNAVFLDVRMPAPDGLELARQVRASALNRTTPIVMITGESDRHVLSRAFEAGANFVLFKPIERQRLLRLLRVSEDLIQRESRRFQRVKVTCRVSMQSNQERSSGNTLDMSLNGAMVRADRAFTVGSVIQVDLEIARGKPSLHGTARVVRVVGSDCMGVHFENVPLDDMRRLQDFLLPLILDAEVEAPVSPFA
jgi:two-component system, chemotaxis family, chemotaxis protein CheY